MEISLLFKEFNHYGRPPLSERLEMYVFVAAGHAAFGMSVNSFTKRYRYFPFLKLPGADQKIEPVHSKTLRRRYYETKKIIDQYDACSEGVVCGIDQSLRTAVQKFIDDRIQALKSHRHARMT